MGRRGPQPKVPEEPNPLSAAAHAALARAREDFKDLSSRVSWRKYKDRMKCPVEWFELLKALAMMDLFSMRTEPQKAEEIVKLQAASGVVPLDYELEAGPAITIMQMRLDEHYQPIKKWISEALDKALSDKTPEEWVKDMGGDAFRENMRLMLRSPVAQVRMAAIDNVADRALPKPRRAEGEEDERGMYMPASVAKQLMKGFEVMARKLPDPKRDLPEIESRPVLELPDGDG